MFKRVVALTAASAAWLAVTAATAPTEPVAGNPVPELRPVSVSVLEGAEYPGAVTEDSPGWDCTMMGNHVCGPGNAQGAPVGRYDEGGVSLPPGWAA